MGLSLKLVTFQSDQACYSGIGDFRPIHILANGSLSYSNSDLEPIPLDFFNENKEKNGQKLFVNVSWDL